MSAHHDTFNWHHVGDDSEAIKSFGYDPNTQVLRIHWHSGGKSDHFKVTPKMFAQMKEADSKGGFYHSHLRKHHPGSRVG